MSCEQTQRWASKSHACALHSRHVLTLVLELCQDGADSLRRRGGQHTRALQRERPGALGPPLLSKDNEEEARLTREGAAGGARGGAARAKKWRQIPLHRARDRAVPGPARVVLRSVRTVSYSGGVGR